MDDPKEIRQNTVWTFETAEVNNSEAATGVVLWKKGVFKGRIHCDILLSEYYTKY